MKWLYAFTTLNYIGAKFKVALKNDTYINSKDNQPITFNTKTFNSKGEVVTSTKDSILEPNTYQFLEQINLISTPQEEFLMLVELTSLKKNIFSPEHQIEYQMPNGKNCSFVVDHIPVFPNKPPSTIVLLAHKCWVNSEINTYCCIMPASLERSEDVVYELLLLSESGKVLFRENAMHKINTSKIINIKEMLKQIGISTNQHMQFFNLCFKIDGVQCVIYNVMHNEKTDNLGIEHSLPPYYYTDKKDLSNIRKNAFQGII